MIFKSTEIAKSDQLFSNAGPQSLIGKILLFPLTRILIAAIFLAPAIAIHTLFELVMLPEIPERFRDFAMGLDAVIGFGLLIFLYSLYTKCIEKRAAIELGLSGVFKESLLGMAFGGGLMSLMVIILAAAGYYSIDSLNPDKLIIFKGLFSLGIAAFIEEIFFRLILFRLSEEFLGSWLALIINVLFFGFAHFGNPNATLWTSLAVGIEAGIILSAAYMLTKRIWFPLALHFGWNFFQAKIFGVTTSGHSFEGLIVPVINGPEWLTGGAFGIEGSVTAVVLCLGVSYYFLKLANKNNQIVQPVWIRSKKI